MPLLVIEPKGLLFRKTDLRDDNLENTAAENCLVFKDHRLLFREGTRDFLDFIYNRYTIGFYSSLPKKLLKQILNLLLTPEQKSKTLFVWGEDRLRLDTNTYNFRTYKSIKDVLQNPEINCRRVWNYSNVVFLESNCKKVQKIPMLNLCLVKKFSGSPTDLILYDLMGTLPKHYFHGSLSVLDGMFGDESD